MKQMKMAVAGALVAASMAGMSTAQTTATQTSTAAPAVAQPAAPKTWVDSITLKGDMRYRYEAISDDSKLNASKETYTRERNRIRARVGAEAKVNDNLKAVVGWTTDEGTASGDPISGNQTLTGGGSKKPFWLDLAYLDYNFFGDNPNEVHAIGGKMKNPFITMPDDLVWDPDLTPEGLAIKSQLGGDFATLYANAGYVWVQERSANADDTMLYEGQAAVKLQFIPEIALTLGGSYYDFQHVKGFDCVDYVSPAGSYGNTTTKGTVSGGTTNKAWATDFKPVVYFAQIDIWAGQLPISVFAQGINNSEADKNNKGQMCGVSVGKAKNPKTYEFGYSYAKLEQDATLGMWTDSDRWGGGTDGKGSKFSAKYQIMKNLQVGATYFVDQKLIADPSKEKDYSRLQVDLVATF